MRTFNNIQTQSDLKSLLISNMAFVFAVGLLTLAYIESSMPGFINMAGEFDIGKVMIVGITVVITFIVSLIAALIGVSLISPVATTVGGALKNGNLTGAANSVTAQITLIFVTLVIVGVLVFLALFGFLASAAAHDG